MTYEEVVAYLYSQLPMFTRIGAAAFKKDLTNTIALCEAIGNPQNEFKSIHIAGTNGKGSVSHFLCSVLMETGFKTGLYTSPHLVDFRERIKVNGLMISEKEVVEYVTSQKKVIDEVQPSFFEMTVAMAFNHFRNEKVDIAVIETGLGGRLDSTNIITPVASIITNISLDHIQMLGNTLPEIAFEKAGIIKPSIPVVIGKSQPETAAVFNTKANECHSPIYFADVEVKKENCFKHDGMLNATFDSAWGTIELVSPLSASYQLENMATVVCAADIINHEGVSISKQNIEDGVRNVIKNTNLQGRWQTLSSNPRIICDIAHNIAGIHAVKRQLKEESYTNLHIVFGMVKDKDIEGTLKLLPKEATYYFTQPQIPRALNWGELTKQANKTGLNGKGFSSVRDAIQSAMLNSSNEDLILITGSAFIVAEALEHFLKN